MKTFIFNTFLIASVVHANFSYAFEIKSYPIYPIVNVSSEDRIEKLSDLILFASDSIKARRTDFQGAIAAENSIQLSDFRVARHKRKMTSLISGGELSLHSGYIESNFYAMGSTVISNLGSNYPLTMTASDYTALPKTISIQESTYTRIQINQSEPPLNFAKFNEELHSFSNELRKTSKSLPFNETIVLKSPQTTLDINGETFFNLNKNISISSNNPKNKLIINVSGVDIDISRVTVKLLKHMKAHNIFWNFYQAEQINLTETGNGDIGFPGIFIAPLAEVVFTEGSITGAMYVRSLSGGDNEAVSTGQFNRGQSIELKLD